MSAEANETVIAGQKRALELAVHGAPLPAVLDVLVRTIESQSSGGVLGSILLLDGKHLRHGAAPSLPAEYCAAIDGIEIGPAVGSCGTAAHSARTVIVKDIATDHLWRSFKDLALAHGLRACWSTPILSSKNEVLGTFALYHRVPATPSDRDQQIVELLGNTAAIVIERDSATRAKEHADDQLRQALQQQMARIGALFEHAPAGIAVLRGPEHRFDMANDAYRRLVGGRDVAGKSVLAALPELEGQGFDQLLDEVRSTRQPYTGRAQRVVLRRDGRDDELFCDFVYQPVLDAAGNVDAILVVAFEVTELVRARQRAVASEQTLRELIDNLPALAWTARPDGHIDYYNRRWYEYTGTTPETMQGWGWEKVHDPAILPDVRARWQRSLATGESFEMEFPLRGADGISRWFLTRVEPQRDGAGDIIRWVGTNTNIDDIRAAKLLTQQMAEQSIDVQRMLVELRAAKEAAERRITELEARR